MASGADHGTTKAAEANRMKLLVSVRNLMELEVVAASGVDVIDLKEPALGPLGQVSQVVSSQAIRMVAGRAMTSLAMGELVDLPVSPVEVSSGFHFAKIGLSGIRIAGELRDRWIAWKGTLDPRCSPVVVAYADHENSSSLPVQELAGFAVDVSAKWFLVDTWSKNGRGLLDWVEAGELKSVVAQLADSGISTVLAGSLDEEILPRLRDIPATMLGVRGAVCCDGNRAGSINAKRLAQVLAAARAMGNTGIATQPEGSIAGQFVK
jgi:(5-formylfuran-3-yl)methyl phosphate synthase